MKEHKSLIMQGNNLCNFKIFQDIYWGNVNISLISHVSIYSNHLLMIWPLRTKNSWDLKWGLRRSFGRVKWNRSQALPRIFCKRLKFASGSSFKLFWPIVSFRIPKIHLKNARGDSSLFRVSEWTFFQTSIGL